eukprot:TRINITY_DN10396_c0_g1_i5.p1 TRINITY_DN10396_c0_g1~~TRINITY_DN10396_c0_g1_i5.p1  ORF type:complete len:897 (+),score=87.90 TRINITY_DN10396_c0_g1_i5:97-2787(+)
MAPFRLWLHSVHVKPAGDVSPLRIEDVGLCDSAADRVSCLANTVSAVGKLPHPTLDDSFEVSLTAGGLYMLGEHGEECLWLPLASSTIVHYESAHTCSLEKLANAAGLLAYSAPVALEAFAWGPMRNALEVAQPEAADQVWVFVVTSPIAFNVAGNIDAQAKVLQEAMEELGAHGAIRGDILGLRSLNVPLGEGGFASVQLMQRDLNAVSNIPGDHPQSRAAPLAGRTRMTRVATTRATGRAIAAKVMTPESSADQVFAEASYLIAVRGHPNVAHFFGLFCLTREGQEPSWVLMTEAHQHGNLQSHIRANNGLPVARALNYIMGLLQALVHIHSFNLIHRDVKSDNVLLTAEGRAVLIDFGIAVHASQDARLAKRCGTPGCVAPEILRTGEYSVKGDVFGAGIALYEAISGIRPLDRETRSLTLKSNAIPKIPYDLECFRRHRSVVRGVLRKMLRASSQQRLTSLEALHAISRLAAPEDGEVQPVQIEDIRAEASLAPPLRGILDAREHDLQSGSPAPLPLAQKGRLPSQDQDEHSMSASVESSSAQGQSAEEQNSRETAGMDEENRASTCMPAKGAQRSTEHHQDYLPSVPRADAPAVDLLREYRRKLVLKNGTSWMPSGSLPSHDLSSNASSSSPSSAPSRSSSKETSVSSHSSGARNDGAEEYQGNKVVSLRESFRSDQVEMSGGTSGVSSISDGMPFQFQSVRAPRAGAPEMDLLREYRRKMVAKHCKVVSIPVGRLPSNELVLKNGTSWMPSGRLPSHDSSSNASSSSPSSAPSRSSSKETSVSSHSSGARNDGAEEYQGNKVVSLRESFRSDQVEMSGGTSGVSSISDGMPFQFQSVRAPRAEAPEMDLLREYRKKVVAKHCNALSTPGGRLPSNDSSTSASSSSPPSAP